MAEKYDVKMMKKIYGCPNHEDEPSDIWLNHYLQLPFPPYKGLYIKHGKIGEEIENVTWNADTEMFRVYMDEDEEILFAHMNGKPHRDAEIIVAEYLEQGWVVEEDEKEGEDE